MTHYHIRWGNSKLDWQAFHTEDEAKKSAEQLKRRDETYTIQECGSDCQPGAKLRVRSSFLIGPNN